MQTLTEIGSRRIFNEDHDMIRQTARTFFQERVKPFTNEWEKNQMISRECWLEAGELGLLNVTMPEEYGGLGADILSSAVVWEEQSYALCTGPGFSLHSEIVSPYILNYGTPEQKSKYLPKLSTGEWIGAIAMTEPSAGSDLQGMKTTAIAASSDGDYIVNGSKTYITNGVLADVVIVCVKTDPSLGAKGISLVILDRDMKGFSRGKAFNKLGLKAQDTCELFFSDVRVPRTNLLGKEGGGFGMLMRELPQERLLIAAMAQASGEAAFELTRTHLKERVAFGKPLIQQQLLQHRLAKMKTDLCVARAFVDQCLELHAAGRLDSATASMAKAYCTDLEGVVADETVQLWGGAGFIYDSDVCRHYADARVQRIYGGTNEIMMELVARTILK